MNKNLQEGVALATELKEALAANFGYGITGAAAERITSEVACSLAEEGVEVTEGVIKAIYQEVTTAGSIPAEKKARYA